MHIQTGDVRMSWLKANNVDLYMIFLALVGAKAAILVLCSGGLSTMAHIRMLEITILESISKSARVEAHVR